MSIKIENTVNPSPDQWKMIVMGSRNAMNSWERSDSRYEYDKIVNKYILGPNDHELMMKLRNAGTDHRKFMRMIVVYVDITAPLYLWKEHDQYKVGTVTNSCSTMHKIHAKEFTIDDFSHEHLINDESISMLKSTVCDLNWFRNLYLTTNDKTYWWAMIQLLPSSYNQKRTVMYNYEVLANIYKSRKNHKLDEWKGFCEWIEALPYSELITGEEKEVTNK